MSALLALLQKKKQDIAASKRSKTAKFNDGKSRWRILGSWRGAGEQFWHDFGQHFVKDSAGEIKAIYACVEKTYGRPCEVCSAVAGAIKGATDDATMKLLNEAKSNARVLVNACHIDSPEPNKVEILEMPPSVFAQIVETAEEYEAAGQSIFSHSTGKDLIVTRTGTGKNTKYVVVVAAVSQPLPDSVMSQLNNLDEYVKQESSEGQTRALTSVRAVAGLLPAPSEGASTSGLPLAAAGAARIDPAEDLYAAAPPAVRPPPAPTPAPVVTDVTPRPAAAPVATPAPAPVAAAPTVPPADNPAAGAATSTGDAELDALLAGLN